MINVEQSHKSLVLGTALWGWGIGRDDAYKILERYLECGGVYVDTATNYPINKRESDHGVALKWLSEWKNMHPEANFSVMVKVGSLNNMSGPESDLSADNIAYITKVMLGLFGSSLYCISIHWDNRGGDHDDSEKIKETIEEMSNVFNSGLNIGFSGIKFPDLYYKANPELADKWIIQVKENIITDSDRHCYQEYFPKASYIAYGINMGGLKHTSSSSTSSLALRGVSIDSDVVEYLKNFLLSENSLLCAPMSLNDLALAYAYLRRQLAGIIIGPRNIGQLNSSIEYWKKLQGLIDISTDTYIVERLAEEVRNLI